MPHQTTLTTTNTESLQALTFLEETTHGKTHTSWLEKENRFHF
jgi:hypothetical protein